MIPFFKFPFLASPLIFMLIYVWSRNFPTASVSIMGLVSVEVRIAIIDICQVLPSLHFFALTHIKAAPPLMPCFESVVFHVGSHMSEACHSVQTRLNPFVVRLVGSCLQGDMQSSDLDVFSCASGILCAFCLPGHQLDIWQ